MKKIMFLLMLTMAALRAEDWTVDGKVFHNVTVGKVEADQVHIIYDGGLGSIPLASLPPDLQKRFHYDPAAAKASADARDQARAQEEEELKKEMAARAAAAPPANDPASTGPSAPAPPGLSPGQRLSIQEQIAALTADIAEKQREVDHNLSPEVSQRITSQNPYRDLIAKEQQEVDELKAELSQ